MAAQEQIHILRSHLCCQGGALSDGAGLHLTWANWYVINYKSISLDSKCIPSSFINKYTGFIAKLQEKTPNIEILRVVQHSASKKRKIEIPFHEKKKEKRSLFPVLLLIRETL